MRVRNNGRFADWPAVSRRLPQPDCHTANTPCPVLHDSLLAASAHQHLQQHPQHPQQQRPQQPPPPPPAQPAQPAHLQPSASSPRDQNNIDPAISGSAMLPPPSQAQPQPDASDDEEAKTYGKRPLSTSKRAAQNRAAQVRDSIRACGTVLTWPESVPSTQRELYPQAGGTGQGF